MRTLTTRDIGLGPRDAYAMHELRTPRAWTFPEHDHVGFGEVLYLHEGGLEHRANGRVRQLAPGDLLLVRPRDRHSLHGTGFRFWNVNVPTASWEALRAYLGAAVLARIEGAPEPPGQRVPERERPALEAQLRELFLGQRGPHALALLRRFAAEVAVRVGTARDTGEDRDAPDWLRDLLAGLDERDLARLDPAALARRARRSHEHLARTFRIHLGATPTQWLNRQRLECAALRLSHSNQPILAIAYDLGFNHLGHFYRLFTARFGLPPKAWRRRHAAPTVG